MSEVTFLKESRNNDLLVRSRKKDKCNIFHKMKLNLSVQTPETGQTIYGSSGKYYFYIFLTFEIEIILSYLQFFQTV